ncbi:MAG: TRAP transporter permease DctQ [Robiginitomaculum sp.]|nr:MAG: TRAP transporter permease DctQ [Robiginitomaculum sp.]
MFDTFSRAASRVALMFSAFGLIAMTLIICWQVFARYVLHAAPAWTEQAALLLMLWFILFAAAAGVREGFHIQLTLLQDSLSPKRRLRLRQACHFLVFVFGVLMTYGGLGLTVETWSHTIPTLGLSRGVGYIPVFLAGLLIAVFALEHLIVESKGREVKPLWN